ncbi:beta-galactosidase/beta-glucuronidase [Sphaerochaeta pleomorpha str. Grapes]|uniref:Beta-galactosidase/beta-glucuronidase n=1 Tax=Sphaerochaeta pleomorpha (strain ATCC BAA-1885 / DSM 22778 / Grapes) TaxID=158190 RepID=G8QV52_SPHPG|nr:beta-galactosidase/beta-glucuronidase [Sphaerochaeta pleomorpha]AEV29288.1 beta-galactosidase/beta-glucuronidase [Sphaerochaeta pleomorpha str. Grapes]
MEQHITDTSLDSFLAFGYSTEFEKHRVSSDLLLPLDGREAESLSEDWFFTLKEGNQWKENKAKRKSLPAFSPDFFADWEQTASMDSVCAEGNMLYARQFLYSRQDPNEKVFLRFGGLDSKAVIFLNAECIAFHEEESKSFSIDITSVVKQENTLLVAKDASKGPLDKPKHLNTVSLVRTIPVTIENWSLNLAPRYDFFALSLDIALSACCAKTMRLEIPELGIAEELHLSNGRVHAIIKAEPVIWTVENPKLYEVRLLWDDQRLVEAIGFKKG